MDAPRSTRDVLNALQRWRWHIAGAAVLILLGLVAWHWWKRKAGMDIVARGRTFIGVITEYGGAPYTKNRADCSEFLWRALGKPKNHGGLWWGTDAIYDDATMGQHEFTRIAVADLQPGDLAVYPGHRDVAGVHHQGHVAIVTDPAAHKILDCSQSQNGVHEHVDLLAHFWTHPGAIFVRYKG